jgi:hypothetical protein
MRAQRWTWGSTTPKSVVTDPGMPVATVRRPVVGVAYPVLRHVGQGKAPTTLHGLPLAAAYVETPETGLDEGVVDGDISVIVGDTVAVAVADVVDGASLLGGAFFVVAAGYPVIDGVVVAAPVAVWQVLSIQTYLVPGPGGMLCRNMGMLMS